MSGRDMPSDRGAMRALVAGQSSRLVARGQAYNITTRKNAITAIREITAQIAIMALSFIAAHGQAFACVGCHLGR